MKKSARNILIMVAVLIVLGGAALLLLLFPGTSGEEESSGVSGVSSEGELLSEVLLSRPSTDVDSLTVEHGDDSYVIVPNGGGFTLQGYEEFDLKTTQIITNVTRLVSLIADRNLGAHSDLKNFGLSGEDAVFITMNFTDGTSEEVVLGNAAAESGGNYVLKDGTVYIVSGLSSTLYDGKYTYFSTDMYTVPDRMVETTDENGETTTSTGDDILYSLKLSGSNFPQDIQVEYTSGGISPYLVTAPIFAESGTTKLGTIIEDLKELSAQSVVGAKLTPEMLAEFGLDEPNAIAEFEMNSQKHTLQVSTQGTDSYVILDDRDMIYKVTSDSVTSWVDSTLSELRASYIWLNNIKEVDRLTLTVEDEAYRFDISRTVNEEESTETNTSYDLTIQTASGKDMEYKTYQSLYQEVLGITVLFSDPVEYEESNPYFQIEYHRFDGGKDTISFYAVGTDRYAAVLNGKYNGLVRKSSVDKVISVLNEIY